MEITRHERQSERFSGGEERGIGDVVCGGGV